jgi:hypothetical protein
LTYRTLEDWGRPSTAAQPLPIAVAFFTADSVKSFLKDLLARVEDDEGWDLPDSVKNSVLHDGPVGVEPASNAEAAS